VVFIRKVVKMAVTGKTGADAISIAFTHICRVYLKYNVKFRNVITQARIAGVITTDQETALNAFLDDATPLCDALALVASYSGF
jgi:hypothetical protein